MAHVTGASGKWQARPSTGLCTAVGLPFGLGIAQTLPQGWSIWIPLQEFPLGLGNTCPLEQPATDTFVDMVST